MNLKQLRSVPNTGFSSSSIAKASAAAILYAACTALLLNAFTGEALAIPIWIPAGIGLGVLLVMGRRFWPFILLGAFVGELSGDRDWLLAILLAGGSTISFVFAASLLFQLFKFDRNFQTLRDYGLLVLAAFIAAILSTGINLQVLNFYEMIPPGDVLEIYRNWFISDFFGMAFITPIFLILTTPFSESIPQRKWIPFFAYSLFSFLLAQVVFFNWFAELVPGLLGRGNLLFLVLGLAGYFFGRHGAMLIFLMVLLQAMISAVQGDGFFGANFLTKPVPMNIWAYLAFACSTGLFMSLAIQRFKNKNRELAVISRVVKKSEQLFRDIIGNTPVLMAIFDQKTQATEYVNPYFTEILGYTSDDFKQHGTWWLTAYPDPEYRSQVIRQWEEFTEGVRETKSTGRILETWVNAKDGSKKLLSWGMFLVDQKMAIYAFDVTERSQAEHLLVTSSTLYRAIGEAVVILDPSNNILLANDYFEKLTGYSNAEIDGMKFTDFLVKRHGARSYSDIVSSLEGTGRWEGQAWIKTHGGEDLLQFVSIYSALDEGGATEQRVVMISEVTDQRKARELINQQANFDPLTDLPNRRLMSDRLDQLIKLAGRANQYIAVIYLDLDNFKEINDSRGHDFGDALLRLVAERLRSEVRDSDTVARIGGDEFVILLGGLDRPESTDLIVQQLLKSVARPVDIDSQIVYMTASFGIAIYPNDSADAKGLILAADQAMYAAKAQGRDSHYYFTQSLQVQASYRSRIISELRVAIKEKQFELYYQPIVEIATGKIAHAEVLLRWRLANGELLMPSAFIEIAEDSGLLVEIGDWVMQEAINFIRSLPSSQRITLGVNVSAAQLNSDRHSAITWVEWINQAGISPQSIVIEVTERVMLLHSQRVQLKIKMLQELGCLFSIDDFGTGYSSMASLRDFNFDFIKIDRQFIDELSTSNLDEPLVAAMIAMSKGLGLQPIAEGVETLEQRDRLLSMGCRYAQGYLYYRPMPANELKALLSKQSN